MEISKKKLNEEQEKAAAHLTGPMLVVAGAGTGKTTVLVERLRRLIASNAARGDEVLLLTFTEKGAGEMRDRALEALPYGYFDLWIHTFHGFAERILRDHSLDIGLDPDFKLLGATEQWIFMKKNIDSFGLDYYKPLGNATKFIYEIIKHFSRLKDECVTPDEYLDLAQARLVSAHDQEETAEAQRLQELARAYVRYEQLMVQNGYLDFGDLITKTIALFKARPGILAQYRKKFKFIMIDEFQDTNWSQYELIKLLAAPRNDLMVVGDDDQSIYKFRGASLSNILSFMDDFPQAQKAVLTKNYRSGQTILDCAHRFISHNDPNRLEVRLGIDKRLISGAAYEAEIRQLSFENDLIEQSFVAEEIRRQKELDPSLNWSDFAILVRANAAADDYVAELTRQGIPSVFVSLRGLYYKPIILDVIAYLKLLDRYHEPAALFRVLSMDAFRVNHADIVEISAFARRKNISLFAALSRLAEIDKLEPQTIAAAARLLKLVHSHSAFVDKESPSRLYARFVHEAGLDRKEYHENLEYFSYLNQLYDKMKKFEKELPAARLADFLELIELEQEAGDTGALKLVGDDGDKVSIMTVHSAKGLEFRQVFIVELVDKRFPSISRRDRIAFPDELAKEKLPAAEDAHIEEERRLFYVALTRAKEKLYLTAAKDCGGTREKKPSIFLTEAGMPFEELDLGRGQGNALLRDIALLNSPLLGSIAMNLIPDRFSFSQIEAYANCPLQYKFNFILKIPVPSKPVLTFGRVMHNVLREALLDLIEIRQASLFPEEKSAKQGPSLEQLQKLYKKYWVDEGYASAEERDDYHKRGQEMLKRFHSVYASSAWPSVMFLEKAFLHRLGNDLFKGSIDRVDRLPDGSLEIIDYKTGSPKEKLEYKDKKQLILYKIALEEGLGLKVSRQSFFYLQDGSFASFVSKPKDEEKLVSELAAAIAEIKKGEFPPKPSMLCAYCDFREICEFRQV